jgi:hypothetical protein
MTVRRLATAEDLKEHSWNRKSGENRANDALLTTIVI